MVDESVQRGCNILTGDGRLCNGARPVELCYIILNILNE